MSLYNVIDSRKHEFNPRCDAVFMAWDPDSRDQKNCSITEWVDNTTVYSAVMNAMSFKWHVTLYLYTPGTIKLDFPTLTHIHPRIKKKPFCPIRLKEHLRPF